MTGCFWCGLGRLAGFEMCPQCGARTGKDLTMCATRSEVYAAIDSERAYQDSRWVAGDNAHHSHSLCDWITYIEDYLAEAKHIASRESFPACDEKVLDIIRKVAGMAVACMEEHGAPHRTPKVIQFATVPCVSTPRGLSQEQAHQRHECH